MTDLGAPVQRWIESAVGKGARVRSASQMETWSVEMHELVVEASGGAEHRLVLRRYTDERHLGIDRFYDPANEARALRLLEGTDVPAPRLYATDLEPAVCDVPAILEPWVPGEPAWTPQDVDACLWSAAEELARIHVVGPSRPDGLPDYVPTQWATGSSSGHPLRTSRAGLWERVLDVLAGPSPDERACFIHRDYHQGNTMALEDRVVA